MRRLLRRLVESISPWYQSKKENIRLQEADATVQKSEAVVKEAKMLLSYQRYERALRPRKR